MDETAGDSFVTYLCTISATIRSWGPSHFIECGTISPIRDAQGPTLRQSNHHGQTHPHACLVSRFAASGRTRKQMLPSASSPLERDPMLAISRCGCGLECGITVVRGRVSLSRHGCSRIVNLACHGMWPISSAMPPAPTAAIIPRTKAGK